jgi:drug/metabolite transporter (DMT)-like permease
MSALSPRTAGLLFAISAPLAWSVGGTVMRSVSAAPWDIVFWRVAGHLVFFPFVIAAFWGRTAWRELPAIGWPAVVVSFTIAGSFTFHVLGIVHTTVANLLILQSMSPLLVAVFGWLLLGERLSGGRWLIIATAFAGLLTVVSGSLGGGQMIGNACAIAVALCSATHVLILRHYRARNFAAVTVVAATIAALTASLFGDPLSVGAGDILALILLGGVQMSLGLTCFMMALRYLPAAEVTLISLLEPILGPLWVWLFIGEQPALTTLVGGTVVLAALTAHVLLATRPTAAAG